MNLENIHTDEYIVVIAHRKVEQVRTGGSAFGESTYEERESTDGPLVTGQPLRVVGTCYPFIMVSDGKRRFPIDSREIEVTKASEEYVGAWDPVQEKPNVQTMSAPKRTSMDSYMQSVYTNWPSNNASLWMPDASTSITSSTSPSIPEPDPPKEPELKKCPCCGHGMNENLKEGEREWSLECKECGFRGKKK